MLNEILDDVTKLMEDLRKNNPPTYWTSLVVIGMLFSGLVFLLFKTTGIILLIGLAFAFIANRFAVAFRVIQKSQQKVESQQEKKSESADAGRDLSEVRVRSNRRTYR